MNMMNIINMMSMINMINIMDLPGSILWMYENKKLIDKDVTFRYESLEKSVTHTKFSQLDMKLEENVQMLKCSKNKKKHGTLSRPGKIIFFFIFFL